MVDILAYLIGVVVNIVAHSAQPCFATTFGYRSLIYPVVWYQKGGVGSCLESSIAKGYGIFGPDDKQFGR